jgi:heavy metal sensor kinase
MFRTLAARLTFLYSLLFTFLSLAIFVIVSYSLEAHLLGMVDHELKAEAEEFSRIISMDGLPALMREVQLENESEDVNEMFIRIFDADRKIVLSTDLQAWETLPAYPGGLTQGSAGWFETLTIPGQAKRARIFHQPIGMGYIFQSGIQLAKNEMLVDRFRKVFAATFTVVLLVGVFIGFHISSRALIGVSKVREAADQISCGDLSGEIMFQDKAEEINSLIHSVNHMQKRIKSLIRELQDVTNNIAHDLRSPVTRMRGLAETTLTGEQSLEEYRGLAGTVVEECDSLVGVINTMLEIAETDAGVKPLALQEVDITEIVKDVVELFSAVAEDKEIHVALKIGDSPLYVSGDRSRLQRAIANLLDNALKFTPRGGRVLLESRQEEVTVLIAVTDSGAGISHNDLPHVCERFYRADRSRSTPGTGLGLSLVQSIVKAHGGVLQVVSNETSGTRVTIRLKLAEKFV